MNRESLVHRIRVGDHVAPCLHRTLGTPLIDNRTTTAGTRLHWSKIGWRRMMVLAIVSALLFSTQLPQLGATGASEAPPEGYDRHSAHETAPICGDTVVLAEYQAWHGLESHAEAPYRSDDPAVIARHIQEAKARCIDGFAVNWYGPSLANDDDRKFIDDVTAELLRQAAKQGFYVALMYDEGTVRGLANPTQQVIDDLRYAAEHYFTMPAYLKINGKPALFIFSYEDVDPLIDWSEVLQQLGIPITLIDKDPNPATLGRDALFDGFFAWVQPTFPPGWLPDGTEWGAGYLDWFYRTMKDPNYADKVAVGSVWPGFDDTLASWTPEDQKRYIWRRCGQTWQDTWGVAHMYDPPYVLIATWNDFEEGTDIEYGVGTCLTPSLQEYSAVPGRVITYTYMLSNTGKFTDTFTITAQSSSQWKAQISDDSVLLPKHTGKPLTVTLTIPSGAIHPARDTFLVTATSTLSTEVRNRSTAITKIHGTYLPVILMNYSGEVTPLPCQSPRLYADISRSAACP
jgi:hypothetical protein